MRALLLVLCACGGASATKPAEPRQQSVGPQAQAQQGAISPEAFCDRFAQLGANKCEPFAKMQMTREQCIGAMSNIKDEESAVVAQTATCVVGFQTCDDVVKCLQTLGPDDEHLRACSEPANGRAVAMPKAEWDKRNGVGVTKFSQARSTKDAPLEVCTIKAQAELLASLACEDDSHPIAADKAEDARVGNVGPGGRCGSIIDLYRVKCPEATYEVFVDGYVCPQ